MPMVLCIGEKHPTYPAPRHAPRRVAIAQPSQVCIIVQPWPSLRKLASRNPLPACNHDTILTTVGKTPWVGRFLACLGAQEGRKHEMDGLVACVTRNCGAAEDYTVVQLFRCILF